MRVLATAVAILLTTTSATAQSLGNAARKEAERRGKPRAAEPKVYGDADLASRPASDSEPAAAEPAGSAASTPDSSQGPIAIPASPETEPEADAVERELAREEQTRRAREAYWRTSASRAHERVANAQRSYDYVCAGGTRLTGG